MLLKHILFFLGLLSAPAIWTIGMQKMHPEPAVLQTYVHRDANGDITGTTAPEGDRWVDRDAAGVITGYLKCRTHSCDLYGPDGTFLQIRSHK